MRPAPSRSYHASTPAVPARTRPAAPQAANRVKIHAAIVGALPVGTPLERDRQREPRTHPARSGVRAAATAGLAAILLERGGRCFDSDHALRAGTAMNLSPENSPINAAKA